GEAELARPIVSPTVRAPTANSTRMHGTRGERRERPPPGHQRGGRAVESRAVTELAVSVVPPAVGPAHVRQCTDVIDPGPEGHEALATKGQRRRQASRRRAVTELTRVVLPPAVRCPRAGQTARGEVCRRNRGKG